MRRFLFLSVLLFAPGFSLHAAGCTTFLKSASLGNGDLAANGSNDFYLSLPESFPTQVNSFSITATLSAKKTGPTLKAGTVFVKTTVELEQQRSDGTWSGVYTQTQVNSSKVEWFGLNSSSLQLPLYFSFGSLAGVSSKNLRLHVSSVTVVSNKVSVTQFVTTNGTLNYSVCVPVTPGCTNNLISQWMGSPNLSQNGGTTSGSTINGVGTVQGDSLYANLILRAEKTGPTLKAGTVSVTTTLQVQQLINGSWNTVATQTRSASGKVEWLGRNSSDISLYLSFMITGLNNLSSKQVQLVYTSTSSTSNKVSITSFFVQQSGLNYNLCVPFTFTSTRTSTRTITPSITVTRTRTVSSTVTPTRTQSPTATHSGTSSSTASPSATRSTTPSRTASPSGTGSATLTATVTSTPSASPVFSGTPTASASATLSSTPTPNGQWTPVGTTNLDGTHNCSLNPTAPTEASAAYITVTQAGTYRVRPLPDTCTVYNGAGTIIGAGFRWGTASGAAGSRVLSYLGSVGQLASGPVTSCSSVWAGGINTSVTGTDQVTFGPGGGTLFFVIGDSNCADNSSGVGVLVELLQIYTATPSSTLSHTSSQTETPSATATMTASATATSSATVTPSPTPNGQWTPVGTTNLDGTHNCSLNPTAPAEASAAYITVTQAGTYRVRPLPDTCTIYNGAGTIIGAGFRWGTASGAAGSRVLSYLGSVGQLASGPVTSCNSVWAGGVNTSVTGTDQVTFGPGGGTLFFVIGDSNCADNTFGVGVLVEQLQGTLSSPTATGSATVLQSASPSQTATASPSFSATRSATASATPSVSPSSTRTATATASFSSTRTPTRSATATASSSASRTATRSSTATLTSTVTRSSTATASPSATRTMTRTATSTVTGSSTRTGTATASSSRTPSYTASPTATRSSTASPSATASPTSTRSATATPTTSITETFSSTATPTGSATPSITSSATGTATATDSATVTPSSSPSGTPTFSSSVTLSSSPSPSPSSTPTATGTWSATVTLSSSPSASPSPSSTASITRSATPSFTGTGTSTVASTSTPSVTATFSATATPSFSATPSLSPTVIPCPNLATYVVQGSRFPAPPSRFNLNLNIMVNQLAGPVSSTKPFVLGYYLNSGGATISVASISVVLVHGGVGTLQNAGAVHASFVPFVAGTTTTKLVLSMDPAVAPDMASGDTLGINLLLTGNGPWGFANDWSNLTGSNITLDACGNRLWGSSPSDPTATTTASPTFSVSPTVSPTRTASPSPSPSSTPNQACPDCANVAGLYLFGGGSMTATFSLAPNMPTLQLQGSPLPVITASSVSGIPIGLIGGFDQGGSLVATALSAGQNGVTFSFRFAVAPSRSLAPQTLLDLWSAGRHVQVWAFGPSSPHYGQLQVDYSTASGTSSQFMAGLYSAADPGLFASYSGLSVSLSSCGLVVVPGRTNPNTGGGTPFSATDIAASGPARESLTLGNDYLGGSGLTGGITFVQAAFCTPFVVQVPTATVTPSSTATRTPVPTPVSISQCPACNTQRAAYTYDQANLNNGAGDLGPAQWGGGSQASPVFFGSAPQGVVSGFIARGGRSAGWLDLKAAGFTTPDFTVFATYAVYGGSSATGAEQVLLDYAGAGRSFRLSVFGPGPNAGLLRLRYSTLGGLVTRDVPGGYGRGLYNDANPSAAPLSDPASHVFLVRVSDCALLLATANDPGFTSGLQVLVWNDLASNGTAGSFLVMGNASDGSLPLDGWLRGPSLLDCPATTPTPGPSQGLSAAGLKGPAGASSAGIHLEPGKLLLAPNPAAKSAQVYFNLAGPADTQLLVYDISGSLVHRESLGTLDAGLHKANQGVSSLADGLYLVQVLSNEGQGWRSAGMGKLAVAH